MGRIRLEQVKPNQIKLLKDVNQKLFPILSIAETSEEFYQMFTQEETGFAFIAYYSDMLAGAVSCEITDNNGLYIRLIGTLNRHRRKGVGKAMLAKVFKEAEARDIHNIYTFIRVDNKAGFALARKFGLVTKGPSKHDPSLLTVEKTLHRQEQSNRSV